jgi:hypothetical protein
MAVWVHFGTIVLRDGFALLLIRSMAFTSRCLIFASAEIPSIGFIFEKTAIKSPMFLLQEL